MFFLMSDDHATHDDDSQAQPIEKDRGWLLPAYDGRKLRAGLYLVATPIGNLQDVLESYPASTASFLDFLV